MRVIRALVFIALTGCQNSEKINDINCISDGSQAKNSETVTVKKMEYTIVGEFSKSDKLTIVKLVSIKSSDSPILELLRLSDFSAEVMTGYDNGPMDGHGTIYKLNKSESKWVIVNEYIWEK